MVRDAELAVDHLGHPRLGPQVPAEAEGLGTPRQKVGEPRALLWAQARRGTGGFPVAQGLWASFPGPLPPLAHRSLGYPKRFGDLLLLPPHLGEFKGAKTAALAPVGRWTQQRFFHVPYDDIFLRNCLVVCSRISKLA